MNREIPNYSINLAIVDFFPVIFFGISMGIVGYSIESMLFVIGAILSTTAGVLKATWKLIVVINGKNNSWMNKAFRILMPVGFLLMICAFFPGGGKISASKLFEYILSSVTKWFFIFTAILMALMAVWAKALDSASNRANWIEEITNLLAQLSMLLGVVFLTYALDYYPASYEALASLNETYDDISVEMLSDKIIFSPIDKNEASCGLIFYPGGKVGYEAYAPLLEKCAEEGILCVLVRMPDNLAIFDKNAAEGVIELFPNVSEWYIGGHSLGGATASMYLEKHSEEFTGVILLGAYSTSDLSNTNLKALCIYGSEDRVLNISKYEECKKNLPGSFKEVIVEGGCHAYFGDYGFQEGDGTPSISRDEQLGITAEAISKFLLE